MQWQLPLCCADKIVVFMGDCNKWWCIHPGARENEIHQMRPPLPPDIPEESISQAEPLSNATFVKAIISGARDERIKALRTNGAGEVRT